MNDPEDYDAFVMSQRDAVEALREQHRYMAFADELKSRIQNLFMDLAKWAKEAEGVNRVLWVPRMDDALIAVVANDEDDEGLLHDKMADYQLDLADQYGFRLRFILFRASEEVGIDSFVDSEKARVIAGGTRTHMPY